MTLGVPEAISPGQATQRLQAARALLHRTLAPHDLRIDRLELEADGALLMEGEASNLAAKKRALRLAAVASHAAGVVDRLRLPRSVPLTDGEIQAQLADRFALDPRFKDMAIYEDRDPSPLAETYAAVAGASADAVGRLEIEVAQGVVTLNGSAPSLVRKRLAGAIAWRTPGVRDVVNGMAVDPPEEDGPDQLEEAVREVLDGNPLFDDTQIKVGVYKDIVRLTGLVHSREARALAEEEAWRVLGVEDVVNEIQTKA